MTRPAPPPPIPGMAESTIGLDLPSSDAALCYELYPSPEAVAPTSPAACLAALRSAALAALRPHTAGHTWHIDALEEGLHPSTDIEPPWRRGRMPAAAKAQGAALFSPPPPNSGDGGPCLWGRLTFGDAVDDEWWAVWLLRELTATLPPGTAARAWDEDGEFVLIEAAEALPRWVRPELAADRVWWCGGVLHLVPPPAAAAAAAGAQRRRLPPGSPAQPTAAQALAFVRDPAARTAASPKVIAALAPRLEGAPARAARSSHTARLTVPAPLAGVLAAEPRLLAAATAAFVGATPRARAAAAAASGGGGGGSGGGGSAATTTTPPTSFATVAARFSRLQFAQFALAPALPVPTGWPPAASDEAAPLELGVKVAAAFHLLVGEADKFRGAALPADPAALASLPEWRAYVAALTARGAFDGEVEGSAKWRAVMGAAAREFAGSAAWRAAAAARAAPGQRVRALLAGPLPSAAALEAASASTPIDSDAWMADGGAALEAEVEALEKGAAAAAAAKAARRGGGGGGGGGGGATGAPSAAAAPPSFDPASVVSQVRAFVNKISSFEGAEVPASAGGMEADAAPTAAPDAAPDAAPRGLSLDGADFWRELGACLGVAPDELFTGGDGGQGAAAINELFGSGDEDSDDGTSSEEGSSFYGSEGAEDDDEPSSSASSSSDDDGDGAAAAAAGLCRPRSSKATAAAALAAEQARLAALERGGRSVRAAPPPEGDAAAAAAAPRPARSPFAAAYASALDAQLAGTTLSSTFGEGRAAPNAASGAAPGPVVPVDVDANLVSSLLASHAGSGGAGGGLPGPAAGLAAMLGVRLPEPAAAAAQPAPLEPAVAPGLAPPPATPNSSRG